MYDEVDEFHEQRDEIMMKKAGMRGPDGGDSSDDDDVDGGKQTVMDLNVSDSSSGSDSDSSSSGGGESDSSDDEGGVAGAGKVQPPAQDSDSGDGESSSDDDARAGTTADWGKKRDFYGNDSSDDAEGSRPGYFNRPLPPGCDGTFGAGRKEVEGSEQTFDLHSRDRVRGYGAACERGGARHKLPCDKRGSQHAVEAVGKRDSLPSDAAGQFFRRLCGRGVECRFRDHACTVRAREIRPWPDR